MAAPVDLISGNSPKRTMTDSLSAASSSLGSNEQLSPPAEHSERKNTSRSNLDALLQFRCSLQDQQGLKKARKIRVFRNGDKLHPGVLVALNPDKFKTFDVLLEELTRLLSNKQNLTAGVRYLYTLGGTPMHDLCDLLDGECYVAGSKEQFVFLDYSKNHASSWHIPLSKKPEAELSSAVNVKGDIDENRAFVKPKVITVLKNGNPRTSIRMLLNKKTAFSFDQVVRDINDSIKLDTGAVRKLYNLSGEQVQTLRQFFEEDDVFIACGQEKLKSVTEEDLAYVAEKNTIGSKSPVMARRKSVGSKSPVLSRKLTAPSKSPVLGRRSIDLGTTNASPLKVTTRMQDQHF